MMSAIDQGNVCTCDATEEDLWEDWLDQEQPRSAECAACSAEPQIVMCLGCGDDPGTEDGYCADCLDQPGEGAISPGIVSSR